MNIVKYHRGAERPTLRMWLFDDSGALIDFSSGYSFSLKIGTPGVAAVLTKTSGITGAAGSGTAPGGVPNLVVAWAADELDIAVNTYEWQLTATVGGLDRKFSGPFRILDVVA